MKALSISRRYAKAYFDLSLEEGRAAESFAELKRIAAAAESVPHLLRAFADIEYSVERRQHVVEQLAGPLFLSPMTVRFVKFLIEKDRIDHFEGIVEAYRRMQEELDRVATAEVIVADAVVAGEVAAKTSKILERLLGRKTSCEVEIDQKILSGCIIKVGDVAFDGSLKGQIDRMKEELL